MQHRASEIQHWDTWNSKHRQPGTLDQASNRRMREVLASLSRLEVGGSKILEVGCGTGWLSSKLAEFGSVTAVDLGVEIIRSAQARMPGIDFRSGDVLDLDLPINGFDAVVTVETLAHVQYQVKFIHRLAELLKPCGHLVLTTQNKFVFDRCIGVPPNVDYFRKWVTMKTLKRLLSLEFSVLRATSLEPQAPFPFHRFSVLRFINSRRLNRPFERIIGASRVKRLKETAGLGQTLFVVAVKR